MKGARDDDQVASKSEILRILQTSSKDYVVFELLEHFAELADAESDVIVLLEFLEHHQNSIVRHEAAAQIAELWMRNTKIFRRNKRKVISALLRSSLKETSPTARHESIEALGYIGNRSTTVSLKMLFNNSNEDISRTARIACDMILFRIKNKSQPSSLWKSIVKSEMGSG